MTNMHLKYFLLALVIGIGASYFLTQYGSERHANAQQTNPSFRSIETDLQRMLSQQTDAWNRGDLAAFMEPYWLDDRLTFSSGGQTTRGWETTYQRYKSKYPDRATMGKLTFSRLESQPLEQNAVLMLGNWDLERAMPVGGNFSLVWKKIDGNWRIIHDHSSARE